MNKQVLLFLFLCSFTIKMFAQLSTERNLFIIDSIPVITDPDDSNQILPDDIADIQEFTIVTYIFTKEYRSRPDSIKKIPSLDRLKMKEEVWCLNNTPYSGKYIDYYYCGKIQDEGILINGKLNGYLKIYFKNGLVKSVYNYKNGILNGENFEYYKNGALKLKCNYTDGKKTGLSESYFPNGQLEVSNLLKKGTTFDTAWITYFSTGKIRQIQLAKKGTLVHYPKEEKINDLQCKYQISFNEKNTKKAIGYSSKIIEIDSTNIDAYFKKGVALFWEYRFEEAINEFDKALKFEPLMREALAYRGLARLKKYQFVNTESFTKEHKLGLLYAWVTSPIPNEDIEKICTDLQQSVFLEFSAPYSKKIIAEAISFYCNK
jgi:antitoxin component YwqK of YwqJK toxin-antitoxin module